MISNSPLSRYQKQMLLKEIGEQGQRLLSQASVLVVGAGGLGCPALQYLAAAGIGRIGIVDFDVVEVSNLHRQILYTLEDVGVLKVEIAAKRVKTLNPEVQVEIFSEKMDTKNALSIIERFDVVLDGSDNFPTRYLINDACVLLDKPLVYGSVFRFEGQVSVFNLLDHGLKTNYRDLFPEPPNPADVVDCNEAGVVGVLPGIIGTMQANEAIKIITGAGSPLANRLFCYNALNNSVYELEISPLPDAQKQLPKTPEAFMKMNYEWFCKMISDEFTDIDGPAFDQLRQTKTPIIIDVRNLDEWPKVTEFEHLRIPLAELEQNLDKLDPSRPLVIFCQTGVRSITAARLITEKLSACSVYNLKGGIIQWKSKQ
ncbi:MAG: HesA/MoeB/ThiF family protein [Saprospiraceae bacterium]|nr:HesA/MoeB/ThiF family protein [Saprospiraceae bacterium]